MEKIIVSENNELLDSSTRWQHSDKMTLSIKTLDIMTLSITIRKCNNQHDEAFCLQRMSLFLMSFMVNCRSVNMLNVFYAECHYAECGYAECHYAECHYAECRGG